MPHSKSRTPYQWIFYVVYMGALCIVLSCPNASADPAVKIKKMTYAELNRLITQTDGNYLFAFMAAWCRPCKEELPILNRLHHRFKGQGIQFVGISVDAGSPAAMERVLKKNPVDFPVYWVGETAIDKLNIIGIPMIFLVKKGDIVVKIPGKCSYKFLETKILDFAE